MSDDMLWLSPNRLPSGTFDAVVGNLAVPHLGRPEQAVGLLQGRGRSAELIHSSSGADGR